MVRTRRASASSADSQTQSEVRADRAIHIRIDEGVISAPQRHWW